MSNVETEREQKRLEALYRYDVLDTPPEEAFDRITRLAKSALKMPIVLVSLVDEERQWFKSRQGLDATETARNISFCTHTIEQYGPFMVRNALDDDRFRDNPLVQGDPNIRFYLGVPLTSPDGYNIGSLCVIDTTPRDLTDLEVTLLSDLARLVVDELELRQIATTDSLTGTHTRRSFNIEAAQEIERAERYDHEVGVIAFDVDYFKSINDDYGHGAGDTVLRNLTAICKSGLRGIDILGRTGGEEFAVVLPETGRAGTMEVAERLRRSLAESPMIDGNNTIAVTASFGATTASAADRTLADMLARADQALYVAKNGGRNCTVFLGPDEDLSEVA